MNKTKNVENIEFNVTNTLIIIEKDKSLNEMFTAEYGNSTYEEHHTFINAGLTTEDTETYQYIKNIFTKIILGKKDLTNAYILLGDLQEKEATVEEDIVQKTEELSVNLPEPKTTKSEDIKNGIEEMFTQDEPKPRRWGIVAINNDIENNYDGQPTQLHKAALSVQEVKKLFYRLEGLTIANRFGKAETLDDAKCREIEGAINVFHKKIKSIITPGEK